MPPDDAALDVERPHVLDQLLADRPGERLERLGAARDPKVRAAPQRAADQRVVAVGFEWPDVELVLAKVQEELGELIEALGQGETQRIAEELGDVLFTLVNVGRKVGVDAEQALRQQVSRFGQRWRFIEAGARAQGREVNMLAPEELTALWQTAKRAEKSPQGG